VFGGSYQVIDPAGFNLQLRLVCYCSRRGDCFDPVKKSSARSIHISVARQQLALKRGRAIE